MTVGSLRPAEVWGEGQATWATPRSRVRGCATLLGSGCIGHEDTYVGFHTR